MQSSAYLVLEGTVAGHRTVDVPAQEPREYVDKQGQIQHTRPKKATSYREVGVNAPAVLDGTVDPDVRSVLSVRWPDDVPFPAKGTEVRWALVPQITKVFLGGRFAEWIVYYFAGDAPTGAGTITPRRSVSAV